MSRTVIFHKCCSCHFKVVIKIVYAFGHLLCKRWQAISRSLIARYNRLYSKQMYCPDYRSPSTKNRQTRASRGTKVDLRSSNIVQTWSKQTETAADGKVVYILLNVLEALRLWRTNQTQHCTMWMSGLSRVLSSLPQLLSWVRYYNSLFPFSLISFVVLFLCVAYMCNLWKPSFWSHQFCIISHFAYKPFTLPGFVASVAWNDEFPYQPILC